MPSEPPVDWLRRARIFSLVLCAALTALVLVWPSAWSAALRVRASLAASASLPDARACLAVLPPGALDVAAAAAATAAPLSIVLLYALRASDCALVPVREGAALAQPRGAREAVFLLDARAQGRPRPGNGSITSSFDLWRLELSGAGGLVSVPRPVALPAAGAWAFTAALPAHLGAASNLSLSLRVYLQQVDFEGGLLGSPAASARCAPPGAAAALALSAELALTSAPGASRAQLPLYTADSELERGYWRAADADVQAAEAGGDAHALVWRPSACRLEYATPARARARLAGQWLAFVGDSTMEELAIATTLMGGGSFNETWCLASECADRYAACRHFDTGASLPDGARVSMFWAVTTTPCGNGNGSVQFADAGFRARLAAALAPDTYAAAPRHPRIVANTGLHDLGAPELRSIDDYEARLRGDVLPLLARLAYPHRLIWKSSNPKTAAYACSAARDGSIISGEAAVHALNMAAARAAASPPGGTGGAAPLLLLDEHALLLPLGEYQVRQHHCSALLRAGFPGVAPDGALSGAVPYPEHARTLGGLFSGCRATVNVLLTLL